MTIDLVCNMEVNPETTKFVSEFEGQKYYFCAHHCKMEFDKNPQIFVKSAKN